MKMLRRNNCVIAMCIMSVSLFLAPVSDAARQPKATIKTLSGDVMVSKLGHPGDATAARGTVLAQGDAIQTRAGSMAYLELTDGSTIELSEHTMLYLAVLEQTGRARATHLDLLWGHIRVVLTDSHQKKGSECHIETLNAIADLTFSAPNVELLYDANTDTTQVVAHTVDVSLKNLSTGQTRTITAGQTGFVQGPRIALRRQFLPAQGMGGSLSPVFPTISEDQSLRDVLQIFQNTRRERELHHQFGMIVQPTPSQVMPPQPEPTAPQPKMPHPVALSKKSDTAASGWSTAKTAIAVGGLAAVAGSGVIIASMDDEDEDEEDIDGDIAPEMSQVTGLFQKELLHAYGTETIAFDVFQSDVQITGNRIHSLEVPYCGSTSYTLTVTGTIEEGKEGEAIVMLSFPPYSDVMTRVECPDDSEYLISTEGGTCEAELTDSGTVLHLFHCTGGIQEDGDYLRQ